MATTNVNFTIPDFTGDTGAGGEHGLVPAPATGDATKFLKGDGTWATAGGGSGDVVGPASAVNNNFSAFDSTTGKLIKDSGLNAGSFDAAGSASAAQTAAINASAQRASNLSDLANAATARTNLGVPAGSGTSTGSNTGDQDLSGYQTISALATSVRAVVLTGLSLATSQVIAATDTVLQAFGYLQAQITALTTTVGDKLAKASNLSDLANAGTARTNLGLGTAAVVDTGTGATNVPTVAQADARYEPLYTPVFLAYTGGSQVNNTTAYANVHSSAAFTIPAAGMYEVVMNIIHDANATTTGGWFSLNGPTNNFISTVISSDTLTSDRASFSQQGYDWGVGPVSSRATGNNYVSILAHIRFTAAGTLSLRFRSEVGGAAITVTAVAGFIKQIG